MTMKKEKQILSFILFFFIFSFFYGIIIKLTIKNSFLFSIKTYMPEFFLIISLLLCVVYKGLALSRWQILGVIYFFVVIIISFFFLEEKTGALYVFRDFFLPVFSFIILCSIEFSSDSLDYFYVRFLFICKVFLILGFFLGLIQMTKGWKWTAEFYTGYSFYGNDPVSKVKITEYLGRVRAPGLTGNFVSFSYYGMVSCIAIVFGTNINKYKKAFYIIMQAGILISTLNKTAIVVYALMFMFYVLRKAKRSIRYAITITLGVIAVFYLFNSSASEMTFYSTYERFNVWKSIIGSVNWYEVVFPINSLSYNYLAGGYISFWDNTYFYLLFSQGIIGLIWVLINTYRVYHYNKEMFREKSLFFELLFVFFLASSAFNNITNGRSYFSIFVVLNGLYYSISSHCLIQRKKGSVCNEVF